MTKATPETVKGYKYASIQSASGGFGMYQVHPNLGEDMYTDTTDLIYNSEPQDYLTTEHADWRNDSDTELVQAISEVSGSTYNEPDILVAMRDSDGSVTVFGIVEFDCYKLADGQLIEVSKYNPDPDQHALAE